MKFKILAIILVLAMLLSACAKTEDEKETVTDQTTEAVTTEEATEEAMEEVDESSDMTSMPIVEEKITLTGFGNQNVTHGDWAELYCFTKMEEITNIHIEWTTAPNQGYTERKNVLLASGEYPDIFFRAILSNADLINYGSMGAFLPLNDLIDEYAYNFNERTEAYPDVLKSITMPDGNIYSMPMILESEAARSNKNWINMRWIKNLVLDEPTTLEELEEVLIAFKEQDANGNGDPNDEIPYSDRDGGGSLFFAFYSTFGIGNLGSLTLGQYIDLGEDGNIRMFATSDNFKKQIEWLIGLEKQGLFDQEMFTQDITAFTAKGEQDIIGAFFMGISSEIIGSLQSDYGAVGPFPNEDGVRVFNHVAPAAVFNGAFAMSGTNPYPAETMRWVDYFYGQEGGELIRLGEEGVTYVVNDDGSYSYTELITKNPDGLNVPQAIGQYAIGLAGGACPEFVTEAFSKARASTDHYDAWDKYEEFYDVVDLVNFTFTPEEQERLNALTADIVTYVDESRIAFVTGKLSIEDDWDNYVSTIERMGLEEYVSIFQAAYDRWTSN